MPSPTLQEILDLARANLKDTQISGGEIATNNILTPYFNEAWRRVWRAMSGEASQRAEKTVYVNFPAFTTVLVPSAYGITDFAEPELIEERPSTSTVNITSTDTSTPIIVTCASPHGLSGANAGPLMISGVVGTTAPWGQWYVQILSPTTFSLNGSVSDGNTGTGGSMSANASFMRWSEVLPGLTADQVVDGNPNQYLGQYLWENEQLLFRGCVNTQQLRLTYWSSGTPPVITNQSVGIDDITDLVACITAMNFASAQGWDSRAAQLSAKAFGPSNDPDVLGGLFLEFLNLQVKQQQRGPRVRRGPFRIVRQRWGDSAIVGQ